VIHMSSGGDGSREGLKVLTAGRVAAGVLHVVPRCARQDKAIFVAADGRLAGEHVRTVLRLADGVVQLRRDQRRRKLG